MSLTRVRATSDLSALVLGVLGAQVCRFFVPVIKLLGTHACLLVGGPRTCSDPIPCCHTCPMTLRRACRLGTRQTCPPPAKRQGRQHRALGEAQYPLHALRLLLLRTTGLSRRLMLLHRPRRRHRLRPFKSMERHLPPSAPAPWPSRRRKRRRRKKRRRRRRYVSPSSFLVGLGDGRERGEKSNGLLKTQSSSPGRSFSTHRTRACPGAPSSDTNASGGSSSSGTYVCLVFKRGHRYASFSAGFHRRHHDDYGWAPQCRHLGPGRSDTVDEG